MIVIVVIVACLFIVAIIKTVCSMETDQKPELPPRPVDGKNNPLLLVEEDVVQTTPPPVEVKPEPVVDLVVELLGLLPEKEAWAKKCNVNDVATKAKASVETVELELGYPSAWLRLAEIVNAGKGLTIPYLIERAVVIRKTGCRTLIRYLRAYVRKVIFELGLENKIVSILHWPHDHFGLFEAMIGFEFFYRRMLGGTVTLCEYYNLVSPLSTDSGSDVMFGNDVISNELRGFLERTHKALVSDVMGSVGNGLEDLMSVYQTINPLCRKMGRHGECIYCACEQQRSIGSKLEDRITERIKFAKTSIELESLVIPPKLQDDYRWLNDSRRKRLKVLLEQEERMRVQAVVKANE